MAKPAKAKSRIGRAGALALALMMLPHGLMSAAQDSGRVTSPEAPYVQAFDLVSPNEGWLLTGQRLYWTFAGGRQWTEITPAELDRSTIQAVTFVDSQQGWMILTQDELDGSVGYALARTWDGGRIWRTDRLSLFEPGSPESLPGAVYLFFLDATTGWLAVRQVTSSNFRLGSLFRTTDGGDTWSRQPIPIGEPVYFVTQEMGWTAGGAAGDELYYTLDGGQSWQPQALGEPPADAGTPRLTYLPRFDDPQTGTLPLIALGAGLADFELYATSDGGQSWKVAVSIPLEPALTPGRAVALSAVDAHTWLVAVSGSPQLLRVSDSGQVQVTDRGDLASQAAGIVELDMVTTNVGWARSVSGRCKVPAQREDGSQSLSGRVAYRQSVSLVRTEDGGKSWTSLPLPEADSTQATADGVVPDVAEFPALPGVDLTGQTRWWVGHGFDKCEIATLDELQTWKATSPYGAVNLYIGGACRACPNTGLTAEFVTQASQQGWRFIPTWVGPQSACWTSDRCVSHRISNDPAVAYAQGVAEADSAIAVAIDLGLALPDGSGAIVYFDLEAYPQSDPACRPAAQAFISGWSGRLRERGSLAGVYTSPCSGYMSDYATIDNVPDAIWPAWWKYTYYNPDASVWNLICLENTLWSGHQRIRQYAGGHDEAWGGIALNIDCNVSDGIVVRVGGAACCGCAKAQGTFSLQSFRGPSAAPCTLALDQDVIQPVRTPELAQAAEQPVSGPLLDRTPVEAQRTPPASESYCISKSVLSSGGGEKSSASFSMNSTQGQSTDLNRRESASYVLVPGYWGRWYPVPKLALYLPLVLKDR
ncbi:MAG: DUF1906 domain-containing protein [Anaerolineae bacterium]|nr:DUF1906 domain-containing protein [Anaerolineae bacterium]